MGKTKVEISHSKKEVWALSSVSVKILTLCLKKKVGMFNTKESECSLIQHNIIRRKPSHTKITCSHSSLRVMRRRVRYFDVTWLYPCLSRMDQSTLNTNTDLGSTLFPISPRCFSLRYFFFSI